MMPASPPPHRPDNDNAVGEDDLQAYVDGQLDTRRRAAIEAYLAAHPGEATRVAAYRSQNIGLHALFDPQPPSSRTAALPPALVALALALDAELEAPRQPQPTTVSPVENPRRQMFRRRKLRRAARLAASIALLLGAGAAAGWIALEQSGGHSHSRVALTHETAPAPQTPLQPLPAAARLDGSDAGSETAKAGTQQSSAASPEAAVATPTEHTTTLQRPEAPMPANSPATLDSVAPAIERSPLIPVPQPESDTGAKDT